VRRDASRYALTAMVLGCAPVIGCEVEDEDIAAVQEDADAAEEAPESALAHAAPGYDPQTARGAACRAACWGAAALGCSAVSAACVGTTTITIGGTAIPCTWAIVAACTAGAVGASLCAENCQP
jgi:hypothetical protein